jgi:hypothetical protein
MRFMTLKKMFHEIDFITPKTLGIATAFMATLASSGALLHANHLAQHTKIVEGQDMPEGSILCTVDCSADPLNVLYPADKIMEVIAARRAAIGPDKKLVVLMGEAHSMPTHQALTALLLQQLHQNTKSKLGENFTMNFEFRHNYCSLLTSVGMEMAVPEGLFYTPGQYDRSGKALLLASLGFFEPSASPVSVLNSFALCDALEIPTCFNDAAKTNQSTLDLKDPVTRQAAEEYFARAKQNMPQDIYSTSPEGMAIRNMIMARQALEHAEYHQANLILQSTGLAHGLGHEQDKDLFAHSLYQKFTDTDADVLVVVPTSQAFCLNNVPPEARATIRSSVIIVEGLAENEFGVNPGMNPSLKEEWALLNEINKASSGKMKLADVHNNRDLYYKAAHQEAADLIRRYYTGEKPASAVQPTPTEPSPP